MNAIESAGIGTQLTDFTFLLVFFDRRHYHSSWTARGPLVIESRDVWLEFFCGNNAADTRFVQRSFGIAPTRVPHHHDTGKGRKLAHVMGRVACSSESRMLLFRIDCSIRMCRRHKKKKPWTPIVNKYSAGVSIKLGVFRWDWLGSIVLLSSSLTGNSTIAQISDGLNPSVDCMCSDNDRLYRVIGTGCYPVWDGVERFI